MDAALTRGCWWHNILTPEPQCENGARMNSPADRERYNQIIDKWPKLFENPPNARYKILSGPSEVAKAEHDQEEDLQARGLPESWSRTGVVYEDPYLIVLRDAVRRPNGTLGTYVRTAPASGAAGAAVLPLLDGKIVLVSHFRHATRKWHKEIPRGYGEEGVSPADQARKELREEIEAEADRLIPLGAFHTNTGSAVDKVELFLAEISAFGSPQTAEGIDAIEVHTPHQIAQLIYAGAAADDDDDDDRPRAITDSFTIGAFTRAWLGGLLRSLPTLTPPDNVGATPDD
jgi:ADP-ribose pyrophosphatase